LNLGNVAGPAVAHLAGQVAELPERLKALSAARNELNLKSPSIPRRAFVAARKGIKEGEATHKVDKEDWQDVGIEFSDEHGQQRCAFCNRAVNHCDLDHNASIQDGAALRQQCNCAAFPI
jgi:hypothetical protein